MKNFWALVLALIPFNSFASQELQHAPTVQQCRADQRWWFSKLEEPSTVGVADVTYQQLKNWQKELVACVSVDPHFQNGYVNTLSETNAAIVGRFMNFLDRHSLYNQFIAEDAQGKR